MTEARSKLIDPTHAGTYHCINRCVRRSWLCGYDPYLKRSFEHRKDWVEERILAIGEIFACGIYGYAVMSNHLHIVVHMNPLLARGWSDIEVATRWVKLYPSGKLDTDQLKIHRISEDPERIAVYRARLGNLSWLMKSISEPIARRANAEDDTDGRFWQGRFKCQVLRNEQALLAAMTYVDLNPVRAGMASGISTSQHTSVEARYRQVWKDPNQAKQALLPLIGAKSFNFPNITVGDYLELVDFTGRQIAPGKRGRIEPSEPAALTKLGLSRDHWTTKVKGIGSGYWRVVGALEDLRELAKELGLRTLYGTGIARVLAKI
jgi:REP element-mobilizing transposase RayT